jgi:hypothetical protein
MTDSRTFYIAATIVFADGSTITHHETHETHVPAPEGGTLVAYSDSFAFRQAEAAAAELGGEVEDVEFGYYEKPTGIDFSSLDLY